MSLLSAAHPNGVCCEFCNKFEKAECPVKTASPWSRWGNWCNMYEPNPKEKDAVSLNDAFVKHQEEK